MRNLKDLSNYLRNNHLQELARENLLQVYSMDIPVMKLFSYLTTDQLLEMSVKNTNNFLLSLEDGTSLQKAKANMELWEADLLPGVHKNEISPLDLILIYAAQKKALFSFIKDYAESAKEAIAIIVELEDFYTNIQAEAMQLLFKVQKQTDRELWESEKMYHLLVNEVVDYAIIILDPNGIIISWNKGAEKINGYKENEILGKSFSVFYTEKEKQAGSPEKVLQEVRQNGKSIRSGWRVRKDKSLFWADIVITELKDEKENLKGFVKITRDLSEQQKAAEEISLKTEELKRSNKELEEFAYVASHDLQEPLRAVTSYVQLLAEKYKNNLDEDADKFINHIVGGTSRMYQLINSLLEYSRINRNKKFEKIDVNELIGEVIKDLSVAITEKNASVTYKNLPVIYADRMLMSRLFFNLLANAIKFSGDKKPEITISVQTKETEFLFLIRDNGIGILPKYFEKIFIIFQRLHSKSNYPGTGIGLAICKKIVEQHNGRIWVESEPDKGSDFYFTIKKNSKPQELPEG